MLRAPSNLPVRVGWVILAIAAIIALSPSFLVYNSLGAHTKIHCIPWIGGPTPVIVCDNGHAYQQQGRVLVDMGTSGAGPGTIPMR